MSDLAEGTSAKVDPDDAKAFLAAEGAYFCSSDGEYVLVYGKDDDNFAILIYVDKNVTMTGTGTYTSGGNTYTRKYNCSLKTGWNYIFASMSGTTETYTTGAAPSGYKWQVINIDDF
jgi:hypothetical protein